MSREAPLVLVADDDALSVLVLQELLTRASYTTLTCSSGNEAYSLACQERPDLILLDVQMEQRYTGVMTLQKLRETPATTAIPVILCSADSYALDTLGQYVKTYNCEVLTKTFHLESVLELVRQALGTRPMP